MMRFFRRLFDRTPPFVSITPREQRNREIDKLIASNRQDTHRERILIRRQAQVSTRYYNAMTQAMDILKEPA